MLRVHRENVGPVGVYESSPPPINREVLAASYQQSFGLPPTAGDINGIVLTSAFSYNEIATARFRVSVSDLPNYNFVIAGVCLNYDYDPVQPSVFEFNGSMLQAAPSSGVNAVYRAIPVFGWAQMGATPDIVQVQDLQWLTASPSDNVQLDFHERFVVVQGSTTPPTDKPQIFAGVAICEIGTTESSPVVYGTMSFRRDLADIPVFDGSR